jgi:hypothetical protein
MSLMPESSSGTCTHNFSVARVLVCDPFCGHKQVCHAEAVRSIWLARTVGAGPRACPGNHGGLPLPCPDSSLPLRMTQMACRSHTGSAPSRDRWQGRCSLRSEDRQRRVSNSALSTHITKNGCWAPRFCR